MSQCMDLTIVTFFRSQKLRLITYCVVHFLGNSTFSFNSISLTYCMTLKKKLVLKYITHELGHLPVSPSKDLILFRNLSI